MHDKIKRMFADRVIWFWETHKYHFRINLDWFIMHFGQDESYWFDLLILQASFNSLISFSLSRQYFPRLPPRNGCASALFYPPLSSLLFICYLPLERLAYASSFSPDIGRKREHWRFSFLHFIYIFFFLFRPDEKLRLPNSRYFLSLCHYVCVCTCLYWCIYHEAAIQGLSLAIQKNRRNRVSLYRFVQ